MDSEYAVNLDSGYTEGLVVGGTEARLDQFSTRVVPRIVYLFIRGLHSVSRTDSFTYDFIFRYFN